MAPAPTATAGAQSFPDLLSPSGGSSSSVLMTTKANAQKAPAATRGSPAVPSSDGGIVENGHAGESSGLPPPGTGGGGSSSSSSSSSPTAVTAERKRQLLLEARRDRLSWIEGAAMPFRRDAGDGPLLESITSGSGGGGNGSGGASEAVAVLASLSDQAGEEASASIGRAFEVVAALYGTSLKEEDGEGWSGGLSRDEALERMKRQLETNATEADLNKIISSIKVDGKDDEKDEQYGEREFAVAYRQFVEKLKSPECTDLVQGMKHFCLTVRGMADALVDKSKTKGSNGCSEDDVKELASVIHGYVDKTLETIDTHQFWLKTRDNAESTVAGKESDENSKEMLKRVLEAFLFSKCRVSIWSVVSCVNASDGSNDDAIEEKLTALQFVTPIHLDIHHLLEAKDGDSLRDTGDDEGAEPWDVALAAPISSLRSIIFQHSPCMMLSSILGAYKGVNEALSQAMVTNAGADDVLPTLILSVLRAKPARITSALKFIDLFGTEEQLRGEAGYAYTNLFGAVQFIQDLDFDDHSSEAHANGDGGGDLKVTGLTISPDEFRKGLEKCTSDVKKQRDLQKSLKERNNKMALPEANDEDDDIFDIPASVIRDARLRGEVVDVEWAQRWVDERRAAASKQLTLEGECDFPEDDTVKPPPKPPALPPGFTRSYAFLSTEPEDIRVSDIPLLLQEYRMLVHGSEFLLAERQAKYTAEHKKYIRQTRNRLKENAEMMAEF